jgi:hypothetical protein
MGRVILFDRGNTGGLFLDAHSVRSLPPFAPTLLAHLHAVSDLLRATHGQPPGPDSSKDLAGLITKVANLAVERIEAAVGPLDAADSLVYLTDDDGFVCGSTGAPPRPIKWPPLGSSAPRDLVASGILAPDLVEFLRRSTSKGLKVADILEDPVAAARTVDIKLSKLAATSLTQLAPSQLSKIADPVDRELIGFFHQVIADGRFLETWATEPVSVATSLSVKLSNAAVDKILGSSALVGRAGDVANLSIEQGIVIGIIAIIILDQERAFENVIDRSQQEKF